MSKFKYLDDENQIDCILLVDDDPITNYLNEAIISEMKLCNDIEKTENVEEALSFIENCYIPKDHPKSLLILLDINMPFWDGFEFLDELNSRTELPIHKIDVIILSSSIHRLDTAKAKEYKILDYIVKPLTPEKLQAALFRNK
ncbi:response regulator [Nafulsella turpanensis]|uniref:response regulator n=1 Tax=Nafulsella turpanensis TaxID=1265690 RepID=UPI0003677CD8|nr:response regulator [Nafulsella turpanensis]